MKLNVGDKILMRTYPGKRWYFVIGVYPLSYILENCDTGYKRTFYKPINKERIIEIVHRNHSCKNWRHV